MNLRGTTWLSLLVFATVLVGCSGGSDDTANGANTGGAAGAAGAGATGTGATGTGATGTGAAGSTANDGGKVPFSGTCGGGMACEAGTSCSWDNGADLSHSCSCDSTGHFACTWGSTYPGSSGGGGSSDAQIECSIAACATKLGTYGSCHFTTPECTTAIYCVHETETTVCKDAGS